MKRFSRFVAIAIAMMISISFVTAQNGSVLQTKAQFLGLKTNHVSTAKVDKDLTNASRDMLLEEGFDNEGVFPPDGWTQEILNTNKTWIQTNPQENNFNTIDPNSLYSAMCPWVGEDQDEWLITTEINANGETPLNLIWYAGVSGAWLNAATLKCHISTDDGATWTELWNAFDEIDPAADWAWNKVVINLDAYAGAPFKIAWQYIGNDGDLAGVDGVQVKSGYDYLFTDDFETFTTGQYVALDGDADFWTTWTNSPGGSEDAEIKDNYSSTPTHSALIEDGTDLILKLGNKTSGKYQVNFKYYVPTDSAGYFNIQRYEEPGIEWAFEVYFAKSGDGYMTINSEQVGFFTFNHAAWLQIENIIDLSNDTAFFYVDGNLIHSWKYSTAENKIIQLGGVDFYAGAPSGEEAFSKIYMDDVEYIVLDPGVQSPTITVNPTSFTITGVENGTPSEETMVIGNEGQQDLEYNIVSTYDVGTAYAPINSEIQYTTPKPFRNQMSKAPVNISTQSTNDRDVVLHYDGDPSSAIGSNGGDIQWQIAAVFPADMLTDYIGMDLTSVEIGIGEGDVTNFKLRVWEMGSITVPGPGNLIVDQDFTVVTNMMNLINLDTPIKLNGQDLWVGYYIAAPSGNFVAGCDDGTNYNSNGDWIASGPGWSHLADNPELVFNWNIRAHLTGDAQEAWLSTDPAEGTVAPGESQDVTVTVNANNLEIGAHNATLVIRSNDGENPTVEVPVVIAVVVGINENGEQAYVSMYPNPASSAVHFNANININSVQIFNTVGQMVGDVVINSTTGNVDISSLKNGVYFIKINSDFGTSTQKLVVE